MAISLLVVDDDDITRESLGLALEQDGYEVTLASSGKEAINILKETPVDVLITDIKMKRTGGFELLEFVMNYKQETAVIMVTGFGTIESAVEAMKKGAYDYIVKPIDIEKLNLIIQKAVKTQLVYKENVRLRQELKEKYSFRNTIGRSSKILSLNRDVEYMAATDATVLIEGESGTGKELVANDIHYNSQRADKPLIKVNCAALSEGVIESELFGHEKEAFTGAVRRQIGRFERADGGTLFLDEVGDLSLSTQVKLLRALQEGEIERVGGTDPIKVNVRLIAATNQNLQDLISEGKFREDLYYRLKVVCINIPPLRERVEDIPLLINHFLEKFCTTHNKEIKGISMEAMNLMMKYSWKGNVRELMNCVESMVVMSRRPIIEADDLPHNIINFDADGEKISIPTGTSMREIEKIAILKTLAAVKGNKSQAADILGIGLKTLYRRLEEYGADP
jgi:DNA-binding NtrC family response regulator